MLPEPLSDEVLAERMACGDSTALEILYDRYAAQVLGISLKILGDHSVAEDVLQESFWRAWRNAGTYKPERGSFAGWLFRIARNLAIDVYRRQSVRPQAIIEAAEADPILDQMSDPDMDVTQQAQSDIWVQHVQNTLATLPPEQRQVIELAYFSGMTRQEIAEATGEPLGTIHTRARLGLHKLRQELERLDFEF